MNEEYVFLRDMLDDLHKIRGFLFNGQIISADRYSQKIYNKIQSRLGKFKSKKEN